MGNTYAYSEGAEHQYCATNHIQKKQEDVFDSILSASKTKSSYGSV